MACFLSALQQLLFELNFQWTVKTFSKVSSDIGRNLEQDRRLTPAYFSHEYKYFDQLLQTVKHKTTVLILVFKEFLQTSIRRLISVLYAKGYHDFPLKNFCLTVPTIFVEGLFCVSEKFWYRKMLGIREGAGITIFCQNRFVSQYRKISLGNTSVFQKVSCIAKFYA